jgi:hypothetical protein
VKFTQREVSESKSGETSPCNVTFSTGATGKATVTQAGPKRDRTTPRAAPPAERDHPHGMTARPSARDMIVEPCWPSTPGADVDE